MNFKVSTNALLAVTIVCSSLAMADNYSKATPGPLLARLLGSIHTVATPSDLPRPLVFNEDADTGFALYCDAKPQLIEKERAKLQVQPFLYRSAGIAPTNREIKVVTLQNCPMLDQDDNIFMLYDVAGNPVQKISLVDTGIDGVALTPENPESKTLYITIGRLVPLSQKEEIQKKHWLAKRKGLAQDMVQLVDKQNQLWVENKSLLEDREIAEALWLRQSIAIIDKKLLPLWKKESSGQVLEKKRVGYYIATNN